MLKLNSKSIIHWILVIYYLNTSHVKVKPGDKIYMPKTSLNLNTSHVKVKLQQHFWIIPKIIDLNTSHVKVKQIWIQVKSYLTSI